ncbi:MAG TPA: alanine--tRNA ligase, partial [Gemmatimonadaceae bacterium]|nr:alanine--tRNA ligase [Gemmatimonadaceae bacterium]
GKHNDLDEVGRTARHHTFFEMLGNFSFGDYFKADAIRFAWEFVTKELGFDPKHLRVTVHHTDDEARGLWREIAGLPDSRIYALGDKDNFWQMADTGPCGPCSEIFIDVAHVVRDWRFPEGASGEWTELDRDEFSLEAFVEGSEGDRFIEFWNLVFMQYDRQPDGTLVPLPRPSVDTGAGLERISAIAQGVMMVFHTDVFAPLIETVERVVGVPYERESRGRTPRPGGEKRVTSHDPASFRVLADHARAVAFLLADGVFPSNEGRGYVLRRILRRAVRHAWLLGRREPTLVQVVQTVVETMGDVYPELRHRAAHLIETTRAEEERFLATIDGGMRRFDEIAPAHTTQGSEAVRGTVSGDDAFRLYDTFGFPIDLTELMARERGYTVDIAAFETCLEAQRAQSQEDRRAKKFGVAADELSDAGSWDVGDRPTDGLLPETSFVGYEAVEIETEVAAVKTLSDGRVAVLLRESPFYAESGGQISDRGEIVGEGWRMDVEDVRKVEGRPAAVGVVAGTLDFGRVLARVPTDRRRDTERNHTATHLLHAALREVLGEHVHQAGSLVAPDRLRFDFTHHGPVKPEALQEIEDRVNRAIWAGIDVRFEEKPLEEAIAAGATHLFSEKYGALVRVVSIPGISMELCGGTHVRNTAFIGLFRILSETGVAAGVRRVEAATGPRAFELLRDHERAAERAAELVKGTPETLVKRVQAVLEDRRALERRLDEALRGGTDEVRRIVGGAVAVDGVKVAGAQVAAGDVRELQALGDAVREQIGSGVAALAATFQDGRSALLVVVSDPARDRGVRADEVIRELASVAGGRGGGKPHMAQAGIPDAARLPAALERLEPVVRSILARAS